MLNQYLHEIETSLASNRNCGTGILSPKRVFGIEKQISGNVEVLAYIYIDDPSFNYWYGYVAKHPNKLGKFVSLIIRSEILINASSISLLFERFHYWMAERLSYQPCAIQNQDDAYSESVSLAEATNQLVHMIEKFDLEKRMGWEDTAYEKSPVELRILDIFGIQNSSSSTEQQYPMLPMPSALKLVK